MKYEYTNENDVPVKMTITYRELVLLEKLLSKQEDDWRYDEMHRDVKDAVKQVTDVMSTHYQFKQYRLEQEADNA